MESKGVGVPSAMDKGKGVRLDAKEDTSTYKTSDEVPPFGSKRHKNGGVWELTLQLSFIDRSDLDAKISPERWELIEERLSYSD